MNTTETAIATRQMQMSKYNQPSTTLYSIIKWVNILLAFSVLSYWVYSGTSGVSLSKQSGHIVGNLVIVLICLFIILNFVIFPMFFSWKDVLRPDYSLINNMSFGQD